MRLTSKMSFSDGSRARIRHSSILLQVWMHKLWGSKPRPAACLGDVFTTPYVVSGWGRILPVTTNRRVKPPSGTRPPPAELAALHDGRSPRSVTIQRSCNTERACEQLAKQLLKGDLSLAAFLAASRRCRPRPTSTRPKSIWTGTAAAVFRKSFSARAKACRLLEKIFRTSAGQRCRRCWQRASPAEQAAELARRNSPGQHY